MRYYFRGACLALLSCSLSGVSSVAHAGAHDDCVRVGGTISTCNAAIKANPRDAEAYNARGLFHSMEGKHELALQDFTKAIELKPESTTYRLMRAELYLGMNSSPIYNPDFALADADKAIAAEPSNAQAFAIRCRALYEVAERDEAIAACEKSLTLDPKNGLVKTYLKLARDLPEKSEMSVRPHLVGCSVDAGSTSIKLINTLDAPIKAGTPVKWVARFANPSPNAAVLRWSTIRAKIDIQPGKVIFYVSNDGPGFASCEAFAYPK